VAEGPGRHGVRLVMAGPVTGSAARSRCAGQQPRRAGTRPPRPGERQARAGTSRHSKARSVWKSGSDSTPPSCQVAPWRHRIFRAARGSAEGSRRLFGEELGDEKVAQLRLFHQQSWRLPGTRPVRHRDRLRYASMACSGGTSSSSATMTSVRQARAQVGQGSTRARGRAWRPAWRRSRREWRFVGCTAPPSLASRKAGGLAVKLRLSPSRRGGTPMASEHNAGAHEASAGMPCCSATIAPTTAVAAPGEVDRAAGMPSRMNAMVSPASVRSWPPAASGVRPVLALLGV